MNLYPDIGELGWSLYLYGYLNNKIENGDTDFAVMTHQDRAPIFDSLRKSIHPFDGPVICLPNSFYDLYGDKAQDGFGLYGVPDSEVRSFFNRPDHLQTYFPQLNLQIAPEFRFGCHRFFDGKMKFKRLSSEPSREFSGKHILVFPRFRSSVHHSLRNLSRSFYLDLMIKLCEEYPDFTITPVGIPSGSYLFGSTHWPRNFYNLVSPRTTIQTLINLCATAHIAIGGTSAPPKISMLQGVPTFVLGHEKQRFTVDDNWMGTKCGFYEFGKDEYQSFNESEAIESVMNFTREVICP